MEKIKWQELKVGQEVAIANSAYGGPTVYQFGYKIERITPSGQIVAAHTRGHKQRFDKYGWEYGTGREWNRDWLVVDIAAARKAAAERKIVDAAAILINEISKLGALGRACHRETAMDRINLIQIKLDASRKILEENK